MSKRFLSRHISSKGLLFWGAALVLGVLSFVFLALFTYISVINSTIDSRMDQLHSAKASVFYSLVSPIQVHQKITRAELKRLLEDQAYHEVDSPDDLLAGDYAWEKGVTPPSLLLFRPEFAGAGHPLERVKARIQFDESQGTLEVREIHRLDNDTPSESFESLPKQIASYLAGRVRTQNAIALSDMPVSIRYAVMGIEDPHFLEHYGISVRGIFRAFFKNLQAGRASQGGSTITQQLMKNLFFTKQKKISRKLKEALFAFITEMRYSKEAILEAYLNEVYLGQWSTHEIHGIAEAARYYFNTPATELTLAQSALLAAMVQAPNSQDPHRYADRAKRRRDLVLKKMLDAEFILPSEYQDAVAEPLKVVAEDRSLDDIDYYLDLVTESLPRDITNRLETEALTLYVSLSPLLQADASKVLSETVDRLQRDTPALAAKAKQGHKLQASLIAVNPAQCSVLALQGGRHYRQTQFNRVLQGKRQPGSLFKPFVALTAFRTDAAEGPITPLTRFDDAPLEWAFDKQLWKPKDYEPEYKGMVTVREAIEHSINIPTARIAQRVGIAPIVDTLTKAGIRSSLPEFPSLSLGSADVSPLELAEAYTTIANLGKGCTLRPVLEVYDANRNILLENKLSLTDRLPPQPVFQTVNIMKGTFTHGTAQSTKASGLTLTNFAGKTGTTNEAKDAWFIGFSPELLVLVWVGYDEEEKIGITGAGAALPLWVDFVRNMGTYRTDTDFVAPEGLMKCEIERTPLGQTANPPGVTGEKYLEYFRPGTEPKEAKCEPTPPPPAPAQPTPASVTEPAAAETPPAVANPEPGAATANPNPETTPQ